MFATREFRKRRPRPGGPVKWRAQKSISQSASMSCAGSRPQTKIFLFIRRPNQLYFPPVPLPSGGVARDRHGRWERDAMDALAAADECGRCVRRNRAVLVSRCWDQVLRVTNAQGDGD
jgi:hypothetical protein